MALPKAKKHCVVRGISGGICSIMYIIMSVRLCRDNLC